MNNIRAKQESLSNWREEFDIDEAKVDDKHSPEGKEKERNKRKYGNWPVSQGAQTSVRRGIHWSNRGDKKRKGAKVEEHVEGGINVQNVADGLNFTEIETVDIIKTQPIKGASNWKLEMVTEMLISEGYNDDEISTILTEGVDDVGGPLSIGGVLSGIMKAGKFTYNLGKNTRGIVNRGIRDTKLTKDIFSTAKKLRNPDGVSITKSPKVNVPSKGGGLVKSFKGFMQNVKNAGSNLVNRTKGKLDRINAKKAEIQTTAKDVDVLGGAATNPSTAVKDMQNVTPTPIGDGIKKIANKIKIGAGTAAGAGGVVAGSNLTSNSPSKVATGTELKADKPLSASIRGDQKKNVSSVEKKVEAPITNDGKKTVDPSKNEKIDTPPTKRELRNQRNDALSSKEGRRARRDAALQKKKDSGFPSRRMKSGTPVNQLFNKEEVTNEGIVDTVKNLLKLGKNPKTHKVSDETPMGKAVTGLQKRSEANKKAMELLNHYSWRDELDLQEMGAYQGGGIIIDPSGSRNKWGNPPLKPGSGPTKEVPLTPTQNRMLVKKKTKTTKVG